MHKSSLTYLIARFILINCHFKTILVSRFNGNWSIRCFRNSFLRQKKGITRPPHLGRKESNRRLPSPSAVCVDRTTLQREEMLRSRPTKKAFTALGLSPENVRCFFSRIWLTRGNDIMPVSGPTPIGDHARGDPSLRRIYAPSPVFIPVFRDGCPEALARHVP